MTTLIKRVRVTRQASGHGSRKSDKWTLFFKWCESTLIVPVGHPNAGKPFKLQKWQQRFLRKAIRRYNCLSCSRKNGKSGLIAALLLGYLKCPALNEPGWRAICVSLTANHVNELKGQMHSMALASGLANSLRFMKTPVPGVVEGDHDSKVSFLSSDKASGHSVGADLVLVDELGLMTEKDRSLWNALSSCISAKDGRIIAISVRGSCPMMSELHARREDKSIYFEEYALNPEKHKYDDPRGWKEANPGLGSIKSLAYMKDRARLCLGNPADLGSFLAWDLNLPTSPGVEMIVNPAQWLACCVDVLPPREGPLFLGIDLGGSSSMTAACGYFPLSGRLEVWGSFPDTPNLATRGQGDGVGNIYERMFDQGFLTVHAGTITNVKEFLTTCSIQLAGYRVECALADRYRREEMQTHMSEALLDWPIQFRGQGKGSYADGTHDIRAFQREVISGKVKTTRNLLIEHAISESSLVYDTNQNPGLDKSRQKSRIDALQAAVLAVSAGHRWKSKQNNVGNFYHGTV